MIPNYLKTAFRNLLKNKTTTIINITGLSFGMAATLLILLWVNNELSFDRYHPQSNRIYRITCVSSDFGNKQNSEYSPLLLSDLAKKTIPGIEASGRLFTSNWSVPIVTINNESFYENKYAYIDSGWFSIFKYEFVEGSPAAFFSNPYSIILTKTKARNYFGKANAIGQTIKIDSTNFTVSAVIKDNPSNSSFQFDMLLSLH